MADLFVPSVAAVGLTAPKSVGVPAAAGAEVVFPKVKRLGEDSLAFGAAEVEDAAVEAEKLKTGFGASSSDFLTGSDEALGAAAAAPKANSGGAVVFGGANALSVEAAVDLPKENNEGGAVAASFAVSSAGVLVAPEPN